MRYIGLMLAGWGLITMSVTGIRLLKKRIIFRSGREAVGYVMTVHRGSDGSGPSAIVNFTTSDRHRRAVRVQGRYSICEPLRMVYLPRMRRLAVPLHEPDDVDNWVLLISGVLILIGVILWLVGG